MKVGTDAVLLGAWINPRRSKSILDIGTGSGIIALMMAQKSDAKIEAIDIDFDSIQEANTNFNNSSWSNNLNAIHISLSDFAKQTNKKYDLILSNPPYYENSLKSALDKKNLSKHSTTLPHVELLSGVKKLLSNNGRFSVILPYGLMNSFINTSLIEGLFCNKKFIIYPTPKKPANRILMEFSLNRPSHLNEDELIIRNDLRNFTEEYKIFTRDFYLDF